MANFTSFAEPDIWDLARRFGDQASVVYCAQLSANTGTDELVGRAFREPLDPTIAGELEAARRFFLGRRCEGHVRLLDNVLGMVRQAQAQARAIPPPKIIHTRLGRKPVGPSLPGAPRSIEQLRAGLALAIARNMNPKIIAALRYQLDAAIAREGVPPPTVAGCCARGWFSYPYGAAYGLR